MAISLRGTPVFSSAQATSLTINLPSGIQSGDKILILVGNGEDAGPPSITTAPSGYTALGILGFLDYGAGGISTQVYEKTAAGGETTTSITWDQGSASGGGVWALAVAYQTDVGWHPSAAITLLAAGVDSTSTSSPAPADFVLSNIGTVLHFLQSSDNNDSTLGTANGWTLRGGGNSTSGSDGSVHVADQAFGTTGTKSHPIWSLNLGPDFYSFRTILLRENLTTNEYSHTASGGATTGGAATTARTKAFAAIAAGGMLLAGAASSVFNHNYSHGASSGVVVAGASSSAFQPTPVQDYWSDTYWGYDYWGRYWGASSSNNAYDFDASGGAVTGGAATVAQTRSFDHDASGGAATGGEAGEEIGKRHYSSGGATFSGAANVSFLDILAYSHAATGGAATGGAATVARTVAFNFDASGGAVTSGNASETYTPNGTTNFPHTASGGATTGGEAAERLGQNHDASGGAVTGGAATVAFTHAWDHNASGGAVTGGSATVAFQLVFDYDSSGGASLSGAANASLNTQNNYSHAATGGMLATGAAAIARTVARVYSASGGGTTGGEANERRGFSHDASGGGVTSGSSTVAFTRSYSWAAVGGLQSGGSAPIEKILNHDATGGVVAGGEAFCIYVPATGGAAGGKLRRFVQPFAS